MMQSIAEFCLQGAEAGVGLALQDDEGHYLFFLAIIALTGEQVMRGPERKPALAQLLEEGARIVASTGPVDVQARLYPLGSACALAHVLRQMPFSSSR